MAGTEATLVKLSVAAALGPVIAVGNGGTKVTSILLVALEASEATVQSRSVPEALQVVPAVAEMVLGELAAPLATTSCNNTPTFKAVSGPELLTPKCNCMLVVRLVVMVEANVEPVAALLVALKVEVAISIFA